jgi:arginine exporter protein ArgO
MFQAALHGFLLCCGLILPLGVQNTFVFSQGAVQRRWVKGLPVVVTAALCDTLLITAAVGGVSLIVLTLSWFRAALGWVGVDFLAVVGWFTWHADSGSEPAGREAAEWPLSRQITFAASVSLLNPHAILDTIADTLNKKEQVSLVGFGTFDVRTRGERVGRNPRTGEEIKIPESTVCAFRPGRKLREAVGG